VRKGICGTVIVVIGLLAVTGCGGSSSLSKAEYRQQVELICNKGLQAREEWIVESNEVAKEEEAKGKKVSLAEGLRGYIEVYEGTTEEIADLSPPEESEKQAEELVQARETAASKANEDPIKALTKSTVIFAKANEASEGLEVASCGK
jgi:hypothetical protein